MADDSPFIILHPAIIVVDRAARQRQDVSDVTDLETSILLRGQIQPIVITREYCLVAGERRLRACSNLAIDVRAIFIDCLDPIELECIELEENAKRRDLTWRETVAAIGRIHAKRQEQHPGRWTIEKTAESLGYEAGTISQNLLVFRNLAHPRLEDATSFNQARSILARIAERRTGEIVNDIIHQANQAFRRQNKRAVGEVSTPPSHDSISNTSMGSTSDSNVEAGPVESETAIAPPPPEPSSILHTNFISWSAEYSGPKFNLIHCDFPYGTLLPGNKRAAEYEAGESVYSALLDAFCINFNNFASYSCHVIFWFSMNQYIETRRRLEGLGLWLHSHPLIWLDTGGARIVPVPGKTPGRVYHTAFFAMRGERPTVRVVNDAYPAPGTRNPIHPTQKPEPMLRYFLAAVVDGTTSILDPTCGSGGALLAAESLGAKSILGLELNEEYAMAANGAIDRARLLRKNTGG